MKLRKIFGVCSELHGLEAHATFLALTSLFELVISEDELKVAEERHYQLVPAGAISGEELRRYAED